MNSKEQYILISGSADDEAKKQLYECLFQIKYDSSIEQREYNRFKIIEQTDLNRLEFNKTNFIDKCNKIKNNLKAIICLENLNPRPETLLNDVKILSECFTSNELKEKIFFVFTFSNGSKDLAELRNDILKFNTLFDYLMVSWLEKYDFVIEKIWTLDKVEIDLQNMIESIHNFLNINKLQSFLNINKLQSARPTNSFKKFVIVGPMGYGKSTTGNKLCGDDVFTIGNDVTRITTSIQYKKTSANLTVVDCPGFGDPVDETIFYTEFLKRKEYFLELVPIDAFILVIKFDQNISSSFLDASKQYVQVFGTAGIKSLMILCIQGSEKRRFSKGEFKDIILKSDGYLFLVKKNKDLLIPYCLWDNFTEYVNQKTSFEECINKLQPFTSLHMEYAIDNIRNKMLELKKEKYERAKAYADKTQMQTNELNNKVNSLQQLQINRPRGGFGLGRVGLDLQLQNARNELIKAQKISDEAKTQLIKAQEELHLAENI